MSFDKIERKIVRPPAAHNVARLLDTTCELKTTQNIAKFALGIPTFNYIPAQKMCVDRVSMSLSLPTALLAVAKAGAPAGREQNASLVRAFFEHDDRRGFSNLRVLKNYDGYFRISREILVPTAPTFTVLENGKQVPVVLCGWKDFQLMRDQIRVWLTMLDSGLFSFADYRNSPWEVLLFPEAKVDEGYQRQPICIKPGDYPLFSESDMRELASMYARAQQAAMPIARELWEARESRRRESALAQETVPHPELPANAIRDLFASPGGKLP